MAKRVTTLDIDSTTIRLLQIKGRRVEKWASAPLEPGVVQDGVIFNPEALGATVKRLKQSSGIQGRKVVASVSGLFSVSRMVSQPVGAGELSRMAILQAAQRLMPVPVDELYISWQPLGVVDGERQLAVVGVPRNIVDTEIQALKAAGLSADTLELKAMALARAVDQSEALTVNIEPAALDIAVVADSTVQVMRSIVVNNDLGAEERARVITDALKVLVSFYYQSHPQEDVDLAATPLFLTGQMASNSSLVDYLGDRLGNPIRPLTTSLECPAHMPLSQYAVNLGLALGKAPTRSGESRFSQINVSRAARSFGFSRLSTQ